jgi:hypothetical protein
VTINVVSRGLRLSYDDQAPITGGKNFDRGFIQAGQGFTRDHLIGGAGNGSARGDINDSIKITDNRINIMGDHNHSYIIALTEGGY